jgi:glycosyltransferase involved in cell wall biosynthesis
MVKNSRLLLIGDGQEKGFIRHLARQLNIRGKVIFAGMQIDVVSYLNIMDIYVQPSHFEGVPNAVLEAMAVGLPVIATDVGGVSEIVVNGTTGILVPVGSEAALRRGIFELIGDFEKSNKMAAAGLERVHRLFSREKMVADYDAIFKRVAGQF